MQRLNQVAGQFKEVKFLADPLEYLRLYDMLDNEEKEICQAVRKFAQEKAAPTINKYVEAAEFPTEIVEALKPLKLIHKTNTYVKTGLAYLELAKVDAGLSTFYLLISSLVPHSIETFGSEEQKKKYLTRIKDMDILGGWALTEKEYGSDASSIQTTVKKVQGGYLLNGNKRWIGNGNKDILVVWARNSENQNIEGFIVENKWAGVHAEPIKHKLALRIVQNCQITFKDVFVPDENKMPKAKDFQNGVTQALQHSRVGVPWIALGIQAGVYENVVKFVTRRKQFGKHIAGFQLQQERLTRILTTFQASFLMVLQVSRMAQEKKASLGQIAAVKAWVSDKTREVARLGREMMGGDGILVENYCIKAMTDAEVVYTYEGSYDINSLIAGREITGLAAFK
ncbi:unnamed protein product [Paramecium sonneborni]|uniref:Acyl-CoA dehydrogenase n=1 Tax=Paramecium sonneborni TaxID=65129 RepID=A0A8S1M091_9CILI|nr:unnamed protein product [Paramecium sonneborni]